VSYLATVARETGWSAQYILWELPYALGLGIEHAAAIYNGEKMELCEGGGGGESNRELMAADLAEVRARYRAQATN